MTRLMVDSLEGEPAAWTKVSRGLRDAICDYARRCSPYYARVAPQSGEFEDWPVLTRSILDRRLDEIAVPGIPPERRGDGATSGSTGTPTRYVLDAQSIDAHLAGLAALRHLHEIPPETRLVRVTTGTHARVTAPPDWIVVSTHGLTPEGMPSFLERCAAVGDYFLYVRASAIAWIAEHVERRGLSVAVPPRAVVTTMDMLTATERRRTAEAFGCPVHSWYGMQEICGFLGGTPDDGERYAINPFLTYAEVLDADGRAVAPGESGQLVLTDLHNRVAPVIRYDVGDAAQAGDEYLGGWPVLDRLVGRQSDLLHLENGRTLSPLELGHFLVHEHGLEEHVAGYQCLQRSSGELELRVVWRDRSAEPEAAVAAAVRDIVGDGVRLTVVSVDELETLPSGKRWIVRSELS